MKRRFYRFLCKVPVVKRWFIKKNYVSIVRLNGVIMPDQGGFNRGGTIDFETVDSLLEGAYGLPDIKAVAIVINSPGGTPVQAALIAERIVELSKENKIKTYAFIEDVAASGGYWLACAADEIYAHQGSIVGSVGVISAGFGFDKLIKKYGIERRIHTAGTHKSMLDSFEPEDPKDVKRLKDLQKELHGQFIDWVKSRRGAKLKRSDKTLFEGDVWTGDAAVSLGLVDGCADLKRFMKKKYGKKVRFIEFEESKGFIASLFSRHRPDIRLDADELLGAVDRFLIWSHFINR